MHLDQPVACDPVLPVVLDGVGFPELPPVPPLVIPPWPVVPFLVVPPLAVEGCLVVGRGVVVVVVVVVVGSGVIISVRN